MTAINIIESALTFSDQLTTRFQTNKIILHHTGSERDDDLSAAQIHQMHRRQNWAGIGYHFVIRKNGDIERGRPLETVGAHCYGQNYDSIGVHLCGNFNLVKPTDAQILSAARLCSYLCELYQLPVDYKHIRGHRDYDITACPGEHLYTAIPKIVEQAKYLQDTDDGNVRITIMSDIPITDWRIHKVMDICRESLCPGESFAKTFSNFTSFKNKVLTFGAGGNYKEIIVTRFRGTIDD